MWKVAVTKSKLDWKHINKICVLVAVCRPTSFAAPWVVQEDELPEDRRTTTESNTWHTEDGTNGGFRHQQLWHAMALVHFSTHNSPEAPQARRSLGITHTGTCAGDRPFSGARGWRRHRGRSGRSLGEQTTAGLGEGWEGHLSHLSCFC